MHRFFRQIVFGSAVLTPVAVATWAMAWGYASLQANAAEQVISQWELRHALTNADEWRRVARQMHAATRLNPLDADYAAGLGGIFEWQALTQPPYTTHARHNRGQAIAWYRRAVALRPAWGFAWVHLAQSKISNQELDAEAIAALDNAMRLGPWELGTQRKALRLGALLWEQLPGPVQDRVMDTMSNAVKSQARDVIDLLIPLGWGDRLRPLLQRPSDIRYFDSVVRRR
jgi:hypothetical protein